MPTYINESVLSLPEQVQKNKEDIATNAAAIAEIDPAAITAVVAQVGTNTTNIATNANDITNLQNGLGATNGLVTSINNRLTTAEGGLASEIATRKELIDYNVDNATYINNNTEDVLIGSSAASVEMSAYTAIKLTTEGNINGTGSEIHLTANDAKIDMAANKTYVRGNGEIEIAVNDANLSKDATPKILMHDTGEVLVETAVTSTGHSLSLELDPQTNEIAIDNNTFKTKFLDNGTISHCGNAIADSNGVLMSSIVDADGNKRFVGGVLTTDNTLGITFNYARWELSGGHLMLVLAGDMPNGFTTPANTSLASVALSSYIANKIVGIWGNTIDVKTVIIRNTNTWYANLVNWPDINLLKSDNNLVIRTSGGTTTTTADSSFRIQFDLIIDTD